MRDQAAESYQRHYGTVLRFVRRRTRNAEEAEDVTQDVFEAASRALASSRLRADPELAWLYTVARRRLIDRWQRALETTPIGAAAEEIPAIEPVYGPGIVDAVTEAVKRLPSGQREVVVLKLFDGCSFAEIAHHMATSEEACRMRLSRGLATIRRKLIENGVEP